jgi:hypothetical protein
MKGCLRLLRVMRRIECCAYEAMYAAGPVGWPLGVVQLVIRDGWDGDPREVYHGGVADDGIPDSTPKVRVPRGDSVLGVLDVEVNRMEILKEGRGVHGFQLPGLRPIFRICLDLLNGRHELLRLNRAIGSAVEELFRAWSL